MKNFLLTSGIVLIVGSILLFPSTYALLKVEKEGELVNMKIVKMSSLGFKNNYDVVLYYNGTRFHKNVDNKFRQEHQIGEFLKMKYLEGTDELLFPFESIVADFIILIIFILVGVIFLFKQIKY